MWDLGQELLQPLDCAHYLDEARTRPLARELTQLDLRAAALRDFVALLSELLILRRGHAVPPWSAPNIAWRVILIPAAERECSMSARHALLRLCTLIHQAREIPAEMNASWMVTIDKRTTKKGPASYRRLEILDPLGSAWAMGRWRRLPLRFAGSQFGYVPRRRREHAILLLSLQLWHAARSGRCAAVFFGTRATLSPRPRGII